MNHEYFSGNLRRLRQQKGLTQEQLAEIEAERLDLLMQLDAAKENEKEYREKSHEWQAAISADLSLILIMVSRFL